MHTTRRTESVGTRTDLKVDGWLMKGNGKVDGNIEESWSRQTTTSKKTLSLCFTIHIYLRTSVSLLQSLEYTVNCERKGQEFCCCPLFSKCFPKSQHCIN